jgi:hypothetical protein
MPGLDPGIHALLSLAEQKDVDGRVKPGHDDDEGILPHPPLRHTILGGDDIAR